MAKKFSDLRAAMSTPARQQAAPPSHPIMQHPDFSIGLEFWCGEKRWRCTDVGTRVIVAICLEPRDMVRLEVDPTDNTRRIRTHYVSTDPRDLNGPPYGVAERVFDEYDMEGCSLQREELAHRWGYRLKIGSR
jgi:hypothetical protein